MRLLWLTAPWPISNTSQWTWRERVKIERRLTRGSDLFPTSTAQAANRSWAAFPSEATGISVVYSGGQHYPDAAAQLGKVSLWCFVETGGQAIAQK